MPLTRNSLSDMLILIYLCLLNMDSVFLFVGSDENWQELGLKAQESTRNADQAHGAQALRQKKRRNRNRAAVCGSSVGPFERRSNQCVLLLGVIAQSRTTTIVRFSPIGPMVQSHFPTTKRLLLSSSRSGKYVDLLLATPATYCLASALSRIQGFLGDDVTWPDSRASSNSLFALYVRRK